MEEKKGNAGWAVLGFFLPLIGLILYLVWKKSQPGDARMAGMGALISVLVSIIFGLLGMMFFFPILN